MRDAGDHTVQLGDDADEAAVPRERARRSMSRGALAAMLIVGMSLGAFAGYRFASRGAGTTVQQSQPPSPAATAGREATEVAVEPPRPTSTTRPSSPPPPKTETARPAATSRGPSTRAAAAPARVENTGRMLIRSTPSGAQVSINGVGRGVTPLTLRNLPFGTHTVRVTRNGYAPEEQRVVIAKARPAPSVTVTLRETGAAATSASSTTSTFIGSLSIDSRPSGATVFLNGRRMGETPAVLSDLRAGSYALRLERSGYARWSTSVRVVAGQQGRVTASLDPER